jgi:glycogen synthase
MRDTVTCLGEGDLPCGLRVKWPSARELSEAMRLACRIYRDDPGLFSSLQRNAMGRNVDWAQSALQYSSMYDKMINFRESGR